jgi:hypothetical protein
MLDVFSYLRLEEFVTKHLCLKCWGSCGSVHYVYFSRVGPEETEYIKTKYNNYISLLI